MSVDLVGPGPRPALLDSHWVPASAPRQRKNGEPGAVGELDAHPSDPTGRAGSIEAFDWASGPSDAPILPTYLLDTGIRPESNTCSGGPGGVPYGEVNAH